MHKYNEIWNIQLPSNLYISCYENLKFDFEPEVTSKLLKGNHKITCQNASSKTISNFLVNQILLN